MRHSAIQLTLQKKCDDEPVYPYYTIGGALHKEEGQSSYNSDRSFETEVKIFEKVED